MIATEDDLNSGIRRARAIQALEMAQEKRKGKKFIMVQIGPKTWVERQVDGNKKPDSQ